MSPPRRIAGIFRSDRPRCKSDKQIHKPPKAVYGDLAAAHSSITSRSTICYPKGSTSIKVDSKAALGFSIREDTFQGIPEDPSAVERLLARNQPNRQPHGEGLPLFLDGNAVKDLPMADLDNKRSQSSNPICGCFLNISLSDHMIDGKNLDTCPTSRNDAVSKAAADHIKQVQDKGFEPLATGTNTTRVHRSASVSDMGRYSADYPDSMSHGCGDAPLKINTLNDNPSCGPDTSIQEKFNGMPPKSSSCGQYSSKTHQVHLPGEFGRADLTGGFQEPGGSVGNDSHSVLKSSTTGSIVQEDSSGASRWNLQDHDQLAEYKSVEDMTQYEAEEDEDVLVGGEEDDLVGSDAATYSSGTRIQGTSAPATLASLENTELMLDNHSPPLSQFDFSQFAFSPQASDDGHSNDDHSVEGHFIDGAETFPALSYQAPGQHTNSTLPSPQPVIPLPPSPPLCFRRQVTPVTRDNSSTIGDFSLSSGSYGHTRDLLELSSPQRPELQFRAGLASSSTSLEKNNMTVSAQPSESEHDASMKASSKCLHQIEGIEPATALNRSDQSFARVSILSSDGAIHSLPLSVHQACTLEAEIASHLRRVSDVSIQSGQGSGFEPPNDHYTCHGRLSIDLSDNDEAFIKDLGPGGSQSSSSNDYLSGKRSYMLNAPKSGRIGRSGFYHDSLILDMRDGSPDPMRDREHRRMTQNHSYGGSLSGTDSAGIVSDAHTYDDAQADDDKDWETVGESRSISRHGTQNTIGRRQTGSNLADYSDSGSLSPPRFAALFSHRVVQHPPHPRYAPRSFGLLRDKQSGELVLMPEYTFTNGSGFPHRNALAPHTANRAWKNPYQHPTPLSRDHAHPFSSSPPPIASGRSVTHEYGSVHPLRNDGRNELMSETLTSMKDRKEDTYQAHEAQESVKESEASFMPIKDGQRDVSLTTLGHSGIDRCCGSSAWLSTQEDAASKDYSELQGRGGDFSSMKVLGRKANPTDTPDGNCACEVRSSLADGSSPGTELSSSLDHEIASSPRARLPQLEATASSTSKLAKSYGKRTIDGTVGSTDVAAANDIYNRIRSKAIHRGSDLYDEGEPCDIPQISIHPVQVQKHRQHLIDHSLLPQDSSPASADSRRLSVLTNPSKTQDDHVMEKVPATTACATIGNALVLSSPFMSGTTTRTWSPHRRIPSQDDVIDTKKLVSYNETAPLPPPMPRAQIGRLSKHRPKSGLLGWKTQKMGDGEAFLMRSLEAPSNTKQEGSSLDIEVPKLEGEVSGSQLPILVRPSRPNRPQPRFRPDSQSFARSESPHLYRIPRPTTQAVLQRQRELSIMVLCLCCLCPPTLIIYGHGLMDGVMEWLTHGQVNAFRPREKIAALVIGYGGFVLLIIGVVAAMVSVAMT